MARLDEVFDASEVPERDDFTPIPPGSYTAMIVSSEIKETSTGGQMIVLELDIQDGEHEGRKLFERLNIKNANAKAVEIAYRTLGEIVKAAGKVKIKDTEELHNKRLTVNVKVEPAKPYTKDGVEHPGKPQNAITRYLPYGGAAPSVSSPTKETTTAAASPEAGSAASAPATQEGSAVPPWKRKKV